MRYNNYHKHTMYSNLRTLDCISKPIDYIKRAKELGHTIYLISDEPYRELNYIGIEYPFVTKYYDNSIVIYSFS